MFLSELAIMDSENSRLRSSHSQALLIITILSKKRLFERIVVNFPPSPAFIIR